MLAHQAGTVGDTAQASTDTGATTSAATELVSADQPAEQMSLGVDASTVLPDGAFAVPLAPPVPPAPLPVPPQAMSPGPQTGEPPASEGESGQAALSALTADSSPGLQPDLPLAGSAPRAQNGAGSTQSEARTTHGPQAGPTPSPTADTVLASAGHATGQGGMGNPDDPRGQRASSLEAAALARREPSSDTPTPVSGSFAQGLRALLAGAEPAPASAAPPPSFPITVPFGEPRFGAAMGERVSWLVREGLQSAELTLNPPDLGPIRIELSLQDDAASFGFNATQAETRAAIEQALPRLRELLAEQGITLDETRIGSDGAPDGQTNRQGNSSSHRPRSAGGDGSAGTPGSQPPPLESPLPGRGQSRLPGRVDLFA